MSQEPKSLLDQIIEEQELRAELDLARKPQMPEEGERAEDAAPRKTPAWFGKSASELLAGRDGRVNSSLSVDTAGAKETKDP